ncbi:putative FMN-dependent luciferase-like monooxygenase [Microbacterium terrisoli]|jgi:putative FMN-dependent luciferase-like monooxygenase|uniref:putative FMN-dependent luciferase-like monooxygenase n=1 Tax=Microbacterium terrisoli TaxID=3242192 RepID=UPI002805E8A8|nr:putative FMN-dependent luciferase-like monooxygenase [Microbacterium protaetiae]
MSHLAHRQRLGFFTRVLEEAPAADRYRFAVEQIVAAERAGFDTAWVAQHHFHREEGGLPSPFVLLAYAAAYTERITLGTAIVALSLEDPLRVAEDAAVLARLSGGRFELGLGSGSTLSAFAPFGKDAAQRSQLYVENVRRLDDALSGARLTADDGALYPAAPELRTTIWEATFSAQGAARIGAAGHGLMLARSQPRTDGRQSLADVQAPLIEAYLSALPADAAPRVLASRSVFVTDDRVTARALAERGLERAANEARRAGADVASGSTADVLASLDVHVGTPAEVIDELRADDVLAAATDIVFQAHPVDPPHELVLRSIQLIAGEVAPGLGWRLGTRTPVVPPNAARRR